MELQTHTKRLDGRRTLYYFSRINPRPCLKIQWCRSCGLPHWRTPQKYKGLHEFLGKFYTHWYRCHHKNTTVGLDLRKEIKGVTRGQ